MKSQDYKSTDEIRLDHGIMFVIQRADPYAALTDLPQCKDQVTIDGAEYTVKQACFSGDSEFKWWPHLIITVFKPISTV